ncbi:D-glycero-beta-D-manno-heptose-7-phosphate kinase [Agrobacterium sp. SUL3]|uniref:D-glycero-beta-D-manno-heptose-7-phosphate kinase n=1 Tax=Agrobacterium sp. SUL3 TaxID=1701910 RepID=UPI00069AB9F3|nr:D-glycero-beta-D-manno-heptose-7-phosphate kinase [Agrobacterium sp. SUL3]KNY30936.1 D-beta-D-heptose 1-phosphate adenosyltransferase [Agrobacterium sp. SUL3]
MLDYLRFSEVKVLCIGDVMLDCFISGDVGRISPEGPVPVMCARSEEYFAGGAANVARNISSLGAGCTLLGAVGKDNNGSKLLELLNSVHGVSAPFVTLDERPTTIKTRFLGHGQQMLRVDFEDVSPISQEEEDRVISSALSLIGSHNVVILSDYAKGLLSERVVKSIIAACRTEGKPVIIDPKTSDFTRYAGSAIVTPNQKETQAVTGVWPDTDEEAELAGEFILSRYDIEAVLITRAEKGMTLVERGHAPFHIRTEAKEVFDVVGAGDTVIATLAVGLGSQTSRADAARIANAAAGIVVGKKGTATVSAAELRDALSHDTSSGEVSPSDKLLDRKDVGALAEGWRGDNLRVGFTNGCFDILHVGHVRLLQFARDNCDRLIVGVNADSSVKRLKGPSRPINTELDRAELLGALAFVDAVVVFDEDTPLELIKTIRPNVLVKGADYTIENIVGADLVMADGGKVVTFEIVPGKSTTATIARSKNEAV